MLRKEEESVDPPLPCSCWWTLYHGARSAPVLQVLHPQGMRPSGTHWIPGIVVPPLVWVRILTSLVSMNFAVEKLICILLDPSAVIWKGEISLTSLYLHFCNCETLNMVGSRMIEKVVLN